MSVNKYFHISILYAVVIVEIDLDNYSIREGDGALEVCLNVVGELARDITINITSIDITAQGKNISHGQVKEG